MKLINKLSGALPTAINFGCGSSPKKGMVNIDYSIPKCITEASSIEWNYWLYEGEVTSPHDLPKEHFETIEATMVMEHIHLDKIPNILYCFYEFLKPGGKLIIVVPNFRSIAKMFVDSWDGTPLNLQNMTLFREITYQLLDPTFESSSGRGHQSLWTPEIAYHWLNNEGFNPITIKPLDRWVMNIEAIKPLNNPYSIGYAAGRDGK